MKEALANGKLAVAGPDAPDTAVCPDCGGEVRRRHVKQWIETSRLSTVTSGERGKGRPRGYRPTLRSVAGMSN
jgi:hypothetical protein